MSPSFNIKLLLSLIFTLIFTTSTTNAQTDVLNGVIDEIFGSIQPVCEIIDAIIGLIPPELIENLTPVINDPPEFLVTTTTPEEQPQCADVNQGTLLCCDASFSGDQQVVLDLAECVDYPLNHNAVNGFECTFSSGTCATSIGATTQEPICCQVITLTELLGVGLWCQNLPVPTF